MTNTRFPTKADGARWAREALMTYRQHFIHADAEPLDAEELPFAIACLVSDLALLAERNDIDAEELIRKARMLYLSDRRAED